VSKLRVFLIVSLAVDVNFMKVVERGSNIENLKAELKQDKKK
jgi:hypothetical protein